MGHAHHRPIALLDRRHFKFLERIGDMFGNTGFREIADVRAFVRETDEGINAFLLDDELVGWLKR